MDGFTRRLAGQFDHVTSMRPQPQSASSSSPPSSSFDSPPFPLQVPPVSPQTTLPTTHGSLTFCRPTPQARAASIAIKLRSPRPSESSLGTACFIGHSYTVYRIILARFCTSSYYFFHLRSTTRSQPLPVLPYPSDTGHHHSLYPTTRCV